MAGELRNALLAICRAIDSGEITPRGGAAQMWSLMSDADYPAETDEFRVFAGMASEIQDHPDQQATYTADIRDEARAALSRHPSP